MNVWVINRCCAFVLGLLTWDKMYRGKGCAIDTQGKGQSRL